MWYGLFLVEQETGWGGGGGGGGGAKLRLSPMGQTSPCRKNQKNGYNYGRASSQGPEAVVERMIGRRGGGDERGNDCESRSPLLNRIT